MTTGVLFDVMSVQKYIFNSNRLKENLGASYLVENLFDYFQTKIKNGEIAGNIGGGNAFLLYDDNEKAKIDIKIFTKDVLIHYPGLTIGVGIYENFDVKNFKESKKELHSKLQENKNSFVPITTLQSYGINAECRNSGFSQEVIFYDSDKTTYISTISKVKLEKSGKSKEEFENILEGIIVDSINLNDKYCFTDDLGKLGQSKEQDSHIAVVHIDGNSMGKKFQECDSLDDLKTLSEGVKNIVKNSLKKLLIDIHENIENITKTVYLEREDKKLVLPIRPIILGGDDITFVCDGRLGIYFAKKFMEFIEEEGKKDYKGKPLNMTSCAGISIVRSKYPFYRAYILAEELCSNAKKTMRLKDKENQSSYLDFHVAYGGLGGDLNEIREKHYQTADGKQLYLRPYSISDLNDLFKKIKELNKIPRSKIKELRSILSGKTSERLAFYNHLKFRGNKEEKIFENILNFSYDNENNMFFNKSENKDNTPILDLIEMTELLPNFIKE